MRLTLEEARARLARAKQRVQNAEADLTSATSALQDALRSGDQSQIGRCRIAHTGALNEAQTAATALARAESDHTEAEQRARNELRLEPGAEEAAKRNAAEMLRFGVIKGRA